MYHGCSLSHNQSHLCHTNLIDIQFHRNEKYEVGYKCRISAVLLRQKNVSDIVTPLEPLGWNPLAREAQIVESWDPGCEEVETKGGKGEISPTRT